MPVFKVNVKWGKEKFPDVECNTDEEPALFKAQVFALSGVAPDRQKIMFKGTTIKDEDWGNAKLKNGVTLLMMGSADALPTAPVEKPVFMEDMTEGQLATALEMPAGLTNLGNTCYMNATIQCLHAMPELKQALQKYSASMSGLNSLEQSQAVTSAMKDLFSQLDRSGQSFPPFIFLSVLHQAFPHFAEKTEQGVYQQQDANECWTQVVKCLQQKLPALGDNPTGGAASSPGFIDQYMSGKFDQTLKCVEAEEEPVSKMSETFYQLSCFIEKDVKYMQTGLNSRLKEHITKNSPTLARDAQYEKSSKISRLPSYLAIQFVRFFYKEKEAVNAKILKDVKFTMTLDMFDMCSEDLQQKLVPARDKFKAEEDRRVEAVTQAKLTGVKVKENKTKQEPHEFPDDVGSNNSGYYELSAVLTHKGRSSTSGHYVAWVRRKGDDWLMFDDDTVTPVHGEDILRLSGGGDWHCAYVLLYAPKILEVEDDIAMETA